MSRTSGPLDRREDASSNGFRVLVERPREIYNLAKYVPPTEQLYALQMAGDSYRVSEAILPTGIFPQLKLISVPI